MTFMNYIVSHLKLVKILYLLTLIKLLRLLLFLLSSEDICLRQHYKL